MVIFHILNLPFKGSVIAILLSVVVNNFATNLADLLIFNAILIEAPVKFKGDSLIVTLNYQLLKELDSHFIDNHFQPKLKDLHYLHER